MTTRYATKAFVFSKKDVNESDRSFSVFTDDFGRLDIFAKAIRKNASKLRSGIDIFFMSDIEFVQGKRKKTLTDATVIEKFRNISQDTERFKIANKIGDVLDNFIKGEEKDEGLFNLLSEIFCKLDDCNLNIRKSFLLYYYFLWNAFSLLGYRPEVQKCNICRGKINPFNIYFSYKLGGTVCDGCAGSEKSECPEGVPSGSRRINSDIVKIVRLILEKDWQTISKLKIEPSSQELLQKVSDDYYSYVLPGRSFKN